MARVVSLSVILTLIIVLGITFFRVIAPFLLPLFLAGVAAMLCQPMHRWFIGKLRGRVRLAAGLTTGAILMILTVPVLLTTFIGALELARLARATQAGGGWAAAAERVHQKMVETGAWDRIRPLLPDIPEAEQWPENSSKLVGALAERTLGLTGLTLDQTLGLVSGLISLVIASLMFVIALYYFLADGPALLAAAESLIPVQIDYQRQLRQRFDQVVRAVMLSTLLAAMAQGVLTASALWIAGFKNFFMLLLLSTFGAMIPLAGTWLVWAPCAVWLGVEGSWISAIALVLFGLLVVGLADNVIRTWILNSDARLHPLLAFISVLGGVQVMGLWGVFVGPVVASCLHALAQIFNLELRAYSQEAFASLLAAPSVSERTAASLPATAADEHKASVAVPASQASTAAG